MQHFLDHYKFLDIYFFNGAEINQSLWLYAIHSHNEEMIITLEAYQIDIPYYSYEKIIMEAIKCHHNNFVEYLRNKINGFKIVTENIFKSYDEFIETAISYVFRYYNIKYYPTNNKNKMIIFYLCQYDIKDIVKIYANINILKDNLIIILNSIQFISFKIFILNDISNFNFK